MNRPEPSPASGREPLRSGPVPPQLVPMPVPPPSRQLDGSFARSLAWTSAARWGSQLVSWLSTFLVARLLVPEDYGLVGMATVFLGLVRLMSEFGLGTAVVTLRELDRRQIAQINGLAVVAGFAGLAVSWLLAVPIGSFYGEPRLPAVVMVMGTTFLISSLRSVPLALLQKQLLFRRIAMVDVIESAAVAVSAILLALAGMGYWTLVAGWLIGSVASTALLLFQAPHSFAWPRRRDLGPALGFSGHVLGSRVAWYAYSNADFLIAGRLLGQSALGFYTLAWNLASVPVDKVVAIVLRITPAFFATLRDDLAELRRYVLALTEGLALIAFPLAIGLVLVADDFVLVALGAKWAGTIAPLRLLALYASIRSLAPLLAQVLNALGESRFAMFNNLAAALLLPAGFLVGSRFGTVGVAAAWIVVHPLILVSLYRRTFRVTGLTLRAYLRALAPAASGTLLLVAAVLGVRLLLPADVAGTGGPVLRLALQMAAGAAAYGLALLLFHRDRLRAFRSLLRHLRRKQPAAAAVAVPEVP
jgi:O-antigen/teichoic acid export membrane protein